MEKQPYPAMYSSVYGGIILDPALMVIPIDDHMVHRGHGVFDTAVLLDGLGLASVLLVLVHYMFVFMILRKKEKKVFPNTIYFPCRYLYELDAHLDRFLRSASKAKIFPPFPQSTLRSILVQMTAASRCKRGTIRYWLSAGPGNFLLSPAKCPTSAFYAVVIDDSISQCKEGVKVITSSVPMKSPEFATMKNVNYLPNVLSVMEAEEKGAFASIWIDDEGYVAEGPNVNVAFITRKKELVVPLFDKVLSGCTVKRLLELAPKLVAEGRLKGVKLENITAEQAKGAAEMMYVGSTLPVLPIIMWDDQQIGDGKIYIYIFPRNLLVSE